jgi:hypothetical protein
MFITVSVESSGRCCDRWDSGSTFSLPATKSAHSKTPCLGVDAAMDSLSLPEGNK